MKPPQRILDGGRVITERALFDAPTSRAFQQRDLYSTFFGTSVNDEIERHLFGNIDARGSKAPFAGAGGPFWLAKADIRLRRNIGRGGPGAA